jgi:hypothetical protein
LYNNFGTFSQDYLNILLQNLINEKTFIDDVCNFDNNLLYVRMISENIITKNFPDLEGTLLTEIELYFSYLNDVFSL